MREMKEWHKELKTAKKVEIKLKYDVTETWFVLEAFLNPHRGRVAGITTEVSEYYSDDRNTTIP